MKFNSTFLILFFLLFNLPSLKAQQDSSSLNLMVKQVENKSLTEIKQLLDDGVSSFTRISKLQGLKFSLESGKPDTKEVYEKPYVFQDNDAVESAFSTYFKTLKVIQLFNFPYSAILLKEDWNAGAAIKGYEQFKFTETTIFYNQGKSLKTGDLVNDRWLLQKAFPVDSLHSKVIYNRPAEITKITLDKNKLTEGWKGGFAELKNLKGNSAAFLFSDTVFHNLLKVEALNSTGKVLAGSSESSSSMPDQQTMQAMEQYNLLFKELSRNIEVGKYTDVQQLISDLKLKWKSLPVVPNKVIIMASYQFRGNIAKLNLYLKSGNQETARQIVLKPARTSGLYTIAADSVTEKYGLLSNDGTWAVKPVYNNIHPVSNQMFAAQLGDDYATYWMNKDKGELEKLSFDVRDSLSAVYSTVQKGSNGSLGIMDVTTGKLVLPLKYGFLNVKGNLIALREGENTYSDGLYGGYTVEGKEVIPLKYKNVETDGKYFYTDLGDQEIRKNKTLEYRSRKSVFDQQGKQLNPAGSTVVKYFKAGQPILLQHQQSQKYFFIDTAGKQVIDASVYEDVRPFSNGLAVVRKQGKYGAINTAGQLVIPAVYDAIYDFQKNYALADRQVNGNRSSALIDKHNKVIKVFKGFWSSLTVPDNANEAQYYFSGAGLGNRVYNADGKDITPSKR